MNGLRARTPRYGFGRLPRYCFIPGMLVRLADTCLSTDFNIMKYNGAGKKYVLLSANRGPSIDDHATRIHLEGQHSEQHQLQQIPHKQILLVDQTCPLK